MGATKRLYSFKRWMSVSLPNTGVLYHLSIGSDLHDLFDFRQRDVRLQRVDVPVHLCVGEIRTCSIYSARLVVTWMRSNNLSDNYY